MSLLQDLFKEATLASPRCLHPAAERWRMCVAIMRQGGAVRWPQQRDDVPLICRMVMDALTFITLSGGNIQELRLADLASYGDARVQAKLRSRIDNPVQFEELMVELSLAAWHLNRGHRVTPFEEEGWPDLRVDVEGFTCPILLECKRVKIPSPRKLAKHIWKANAQIKKVGIQAFGVVVLDISAAVGNKIVPLTDDVPPIVMEVMEAVRQAISGPKNRSVGAVVVTWDKYSQVGEPPQPVVICFRRPFQIVRHEQVEGVTVIPSNLPLFEGSTFAFMLTWNNSENSIDTFKISDLMREYVDCFQFTNDELIDLFNRRDKWQPIGPQELGLALFARRTRLHDQPCHILALASVEGRELNLHFAIRIPTITYEELDLLTPFEMLERTVQRYGLLVTVGDVTGHLIERSLLKVEGDVDVAKVVAIQNPQDHYYLLSLLIRVIPEGQEKLVECAFVFALDRDRIKKDL
jgi:hypothetical protein